MADPKHHDAGHAHHDPDPELSLSGIVWTSVVVVLITAGAMVLMAWMGGSLISRVEKAEGALTPAEAQAAEAVRQAGEQRLGAGEAPDLPGLVLPADAALPPLPRLETTLTGEIDRLHDREEEILDRWSWADEAAGTVDVPIQQAIELAVEGALPGTEALLGAAPAPAVDSDSADSEAGEDEVRDAA